MLQRICHTDPMPNPGRTVYAALIYLFEDENLGGTGYYRWKDRDLEENVAALQRGEADENWEFRPENYDMYRKPARYMTESNEIAELIKTVPARFNRLIFYWGGVPHSGSIVAPELLSTDVRKGRLTLNVFASVLPK